MGVKALKVLWFTNCPFPAANAAVGRRPAVIGGWLASLGAALQATGKIELMVVSFVPGGADQSVCVDGIRHELMAIEPARFNQELWFSPGQDTRRKCRDLVAMFQPEVVHVHGTEASYGLLVVEGDIQRPAVVSLQGMLGALNRFDHGGLSLWDRLRSLTPYDLCANHGMVRGARIMARRAREVEARILRQRAVFVGRTTYDRAVLRAVNPCAVYSHCDEVMRPAFYGQERDPSRVVAARIYASAAGHPRKGFHCLLKATALLKAEFPTVSIRVPGLPPADSWRRNGYQRYLCRLIHDLHLESHVAFLGELGAEAVAQELAQASAFALASYGDNSPNGLVEAMLVGTPVVAAFVGGVPSLVCHEESALCFPVGDELVMAECLRRVLLDQPLAAQLAQRAQAVARTRHDPESIARRMMAIYGQAAAMV